MKWLGGRGVVKSVHENEEENNKLKSPNQLFLRNKACVSLALLLFQETWNPWAAMAFPLTWYLSHSLWELREASQPYSCIWGTQLPSMLCFIYIKGRSMPLAVRGSHSADSLPKKKIGDWWLGFYCSRLTFFQNISQYTSEHTSYHLPLHLLVYFLSPMTQEVPRRMH